MLKKTLLTTLLVSLLFIFPAASTAQAQNYSAHDLIYAVNEFRGEYDLPAYEIDESLMAIAQEHSNYQLSINTSTHTRADGSGPGDHGISSENIGAGYDASPNILIHYQWKDYWHTHTLIGYSSGRVGAGVAVSDDGFYYYTLVIKNTGTQTGLPDEGQPTSTAGDSAGADPDAEITPLVIITSTPNEEDDSIVHIIQSGETLWSISLAYEMDADSLAYMNGLDPENPMIYPGGALIIRLPNTPTVTPTITETPLPPTRTLRPTRTPLPSRTLRPTDPPQTPTNSEPPLVPDNQLVSNDNLNKLGIVVLVIALIGGALLVFSLLWNRRGSG